MMIKVASSGFRRVSRWLMAGSNDMGRVVEEEKDRERLKSRERREMKMSSPQRAIDCLLRRDDATLAGRG